MSTRKALMLPMAAVTAAALLAACGGGDAGSGSAGGEGGGDVELTFWHNSTTGPGKEYWDETAAQFEEANPGVTVSIQTIQNEDMDGKLQTALNSGDAPDIFMARGGGKLADIVEAGQALDLTDLIADDVKDAVGGTLNAFSIDGKVYGMPTSVLPGGIYYNTSMFEQAGIEGTPETIEELEDAVAKIKELGVDPIALGGKAAWPAAHWYYFFALRTCSQEAMETDGAAVQFEDPCWEEAAQELQDFASIEPFNEGFLTTDAQGSAASSAGMIANEQAAMELMGAWNPGVIADLTPDKQPMEDLGWFPFPAVEGGEGDPSAMMGGVDGYACSAQAPAEECAAFLNFFMSQERQEAYAEAFVTLPASQEAQGVVTDPALLDILAAYNDAAYVQVWLDTQFGQNVGNALNAGVVEMLAGSGTPEGIVTAVNDAAAKG
ncbi:sugar ABC transporter substrate-binding protein [Actinotalea ferrariae CF5-4]|uniref:Sugar ABC transporter substrate-binding protein n=1 Tax=Actinotalea ferrariae CF5-4 TaxID=948458 RepID=A0A021W0X2_9CELL|nr:extracellular solute-binding protein [Actinotalea ferrariae]EYR64972.1 sugar ABC transporter substrate-binding protein [Actinotalea ferrariae CF5-4]